MKSLTHRYADTLLPKPLEEYVAEKREAGTSWRRITIALRDDTNGEIDVTHETLRSWFPETAASPS